MVRKNVSLFFSDCREMVVEIILYYYLCGWIYRNLNFYENLTRVWRIHCGFNILYKGKSNIPLWLRLEQIVEYLNEKMPTRIFLQYNNETKKAKTN